MPPPEQPSGCRAPRLLVTGGTGFIGSYLCDFLVRSGYDVLCADNLFSSSVQNVEHLLGGARFRLIRHDVSEPLRVEPPLDGILHLATPAAPRYFRSHPVEVTRAAVFGTARMLDLAREHGCRLLLASSDAVYGDPLESPQTEETLGTVDPVGPRSAYDEGKRFAECLTMAYQTEYGVDTVIARIFHSYGERMPADGRLIPAYIANALRGAPLLVQGTGAQTRAFCHISDLVAGILALFNSGHHGPVNLGNPREISILDLARLIIGLAGSRSLIEFGPPLPQERRSRCPDISVATRLLGWRPQVSLEEGLSRMVASAQSAAAAASEDVFTGGRST